MSIYCSSAAFKLYEKQIMKEEKLTEEEEARSSAGKEIREALNDG